MKFHFSSTLFLVLGVTVLCLQASGQTNKVSPKLDFEDAEERSNSSLSGDTSGEQGRTDTGRNTAGGRDGSDGGSGHGGGRRSSGTSGSGKSGPKIHGVRVTVNTDDSQKSKESKESMEITDVGKQKKRVGIHTDITFEITANVDDDTNATSSAQRGDDKGSFDSHLPPFTEDASIPIYKGRGGSSTSPDKPRKPYESKSHWNPNFSSERRNGYEGYGSRNGHVNRGYGYYARPYGHSNVPVYTGSGTTYRRGDDSNSYVPIIGLWTTERSYNAPYRPNSVTAYREASWKPCYCISSSLEHRRRRDNSHYSESGVIQATGPVIKVVDSKLEGPFTRK